MSELHGQTEHGDRVTVWLGGDWFALLGGIAIIASVLWFKHANRIDVVMPVDTIVEIHTVYREHCEAVDSMASIREGEQWVFLICDTASDSPQEPDE